jgi:hypothetical protein
MINFLSKNLKSILSKACVKKSIKIQFLGDKLFKTRRVSLRKKREPLNFSLDEKSRTFEDLNRILEFVHQRYFPGIDLPEIKWSKIPQTFSFRSITFGTYHRDKHLIRIHPFLSHPKVPYFFVEFVVFHEFLHAQCLPTRSRGRNLIHTLEFKLKEKEHQFYQEALDWKRQSLTILKEIYGRA